MRKKYLKNGLTKVRNEVGYLCVENGDRKQEITNIGRALRIHGEAHMVTDTRIDGKIQDIENALERMEAGRKDWDNATYTALRERVEEGEKRLTDQGKRLYQVEIRIKPMDFDHSNRITNLEHEIKDQRDDYHSHIRQLVKENAAAHIQQSDTIMRIQKQIAALETRLSCAQDTIAEMQMDAMKHESPASKTKRRGEIMKAVR